MKSWLETNYLETHSLRNKERDSKVHSALKSQLTVFLYMSNMIKLTNYDQGSLSSLLKKKKKRKPWTEVETEGVADPAGMKKHPETPCGSLGVGGAIVGLKGLQVSWRGTY